MDEQISLGEITIAVTRKDVKNVHLSVHPPHGRVTLVAPTATRLEVGPVGPVGRGPVSVGWGLRSSRKPSK